MQNSKYQEAILDFIENQTGNAIIQAVAGSGKTTTICQAIKALPEGRSSIFLAFNKAIATELESRGVSAKTFHSLGYGATMRFFNCRKVEGNKTRLLCKRNLSYDDNYLYATFVCRLIGLAKQTGIGCLAKDTPEIWGNIVDHHGLEITHDDADINRGIEIASEILNLGNQSNCGMVDFDDMLYIPVIKGLKLSSYFYVFVDEAQDTNAVQRALLTKIMGPQSRLIAVGDSSQAIYGFRGADNRSMDEIKYQFNCKSFPLSISYRCGQNIVERAKRYVEQIECSDDAEKGEVVEVADWELSDFNKDDLVICRTNAPVITLAFKFLKNKIPATILGRDIGQGLSNLIRSFKTNSIKTMRSKLEQHIECEIERAKIQFNDAKIALLEDKKTSINILANESDDVQHLLAIIDDLFSEKKQSIVLSTIHKAKGMEASTVYWLNSSECPAKWAKKSWERAQENNLCYVAITRAKNSLRLIELERNN